MNQAQFSILIGASQSTVYRWRNGVEPDGALSAIVGAIREAIDGPRGDEIATMLRDQATLDNVLRALFDAYRPP